MCNEACINFGRDHLRQGDVAGKKVLEVGSFDYNGSLRSIVTELGPATYMGVDLDVGPGVDEVCGIEELADRFGEESFDVVLCTEVFEHVRDWRSAASNLKRVLRPGGVLLLTTRSRGFPYHGYPHDFWRYEPADMKVIFGDLEIELIATDPLQPGVFLLSRKSDTFIEAELHTHELYSIVNRKVCSDINEYDILVFKTKRLLSPLLPDGVKNAVKQRIRRDEPV
jgi:SAM-dependent methyltransferase